MDGLALTPQTIPLTAPAAMGYTQIGVTLLPVSSGGHPHRPSRALWKSPKSAARALRIWTVAPALSILPPIVTVLLALLLKQVIVALAFGVLLGATLVYGLNPLSGALRLVDVYLPNALGAGSHPEIIVFTFLLGGTIAVVRASGGSAGLAALATRCTTKPSQVLLATASLAFGVGVDDYAAVLITGSAMQPIAVALGVDALQLAWVVHGVGVCTPSIHPLSSWFAMQLALVEQQVRAACNLATLQPLV